MSNRPMHAVIADDLRASIAAEPRPGAPLPSERELADQYGVTRNTVRQALSALVGEGLVTRRHGAGHTIREWRRLDWWPGAFEQREHRRDLPGAGADAWQADVIAQGRVPRQEVDVSIVLPPPVVAERLNTPPGDMVVMRKRLRIVDEVPYQTADSYYPRDVAERSPIMEPGDVIIPGGLMAASGHAEIRRVDETVARMPSPDETHRLDMLPGTPVIELVRTGYDQTGRAVRVIITVAVGDRNRIMHEFKEPE